ncbi:MAG: hypothetical protein RMK29_18945 [Myxococcales bacterium]|nr:hypothetical protein [Myxococcota bacterium]MDW8283786.1 hypothetical protein [Myxococcales bacterium]
MRTTALAPLLAAALGGPAAASSDHPAAALPTEAPPPIGRTPAGYVTDSGRQLPLLQYAPYQKARRMWIAGFSTTMAGVATVGTGVGILLMGGYGVSDLTEQGQRNALAAGGVITAIGAAGVAVGATLWHLGRREIELLERGLPYYDGRPPLANLAAPATPLLALFPHSGGVCLTAGLGGRF